MKRGWIWVGAVVLAALANGCGRSEPAPSGESAKPAEATPTAAATAGADATKEAEQIFATRCFTCHGAKGQGDGPGSSGLIPKPRNFTDRAWQASVDDDHIAKIIQFGGAAVGKSPTMPSNPDLMAKPEVVRALVAHVRSLAATE
jgi:mono/diheme cytochrome c family protein